MKDLKEILYKDFIESSRNNLVSVYKARINLDTPCYPWGGCWAVLPKDVTFRDIENLVKGYEA